MGVLPLVLCLLSLLRFILFPVFFNSSHSSDYLLILLLQGADTNIRCHWTDMNALHYAVYFDCDEVVEQLCEHNPGRRGTKGRRQY